MSELGLNDVHQQEILNYLKFARYNRNQQLRSVEGSFQDVKDSRLHEDTFTVDEVSDMLDGLQAIVKGAVESELVNAAHTNVLLLRQLFGQAEKWHLKLQADISELENRKLLEEIAQFEEQEFSGGPAKSNLGSLAQKPKLEPLNEGGSAALLHMEISRLKEENEALKNKVKSIEKSAKESLDDRNRLRSDLNQARNQPSAQSPQVDDGQVAVLSERITALNASLKEAEEQYQQRTSSVDEELSNTKHYVLALQHELEVLNQEFDKKFSETTQFKNLKKMLEGKNTQLKDMRNRLRKYEPDLEI